MCTGTPVHYEQTVRMSYEGAWPGREEGGSECVRIHRYTMSKQSDNQCRAATRGAGGHRKYVRLHLYTVSKHPGTSIRPYIEALENAFSELKSAGSPTGRVGAPLPSSPPPSDSGSGEKTSTTGKEYWAALPPVKHSMPVGSLANAFNPAEVAAGADTRPLFSST
jgi:hypothetical protein